MQRRTLLTVGLVAGTLLALAGGTLALLKPSRKGGLLTTAGRDVFGAVAQAVLGASLPDEPGSRAQVLAGHLSRIEQTIAGMPPAVQAEVDELVTIAASAPGRLALIGLNAEWSSATVQQVSDALQAMRDSPLALRQQAYQGLRELTNAAFFADPANWAAMGYTGQRSLSLGSRA
jgi:hypothetical protein